MKKLLTHNWTRAREKPENLVYMEEPAPTQPAHTCTTENKRWGTDWPSVNQLVWKTHHIKSQQEPKTNDIHRANIKHSSRSVRSGDQGDYSTESQRYSTTKVHTKNSDQGVRTEQRKKQRLTGRVSQAMGRQRNNPQMKGKGEVSETMLNEKQASKLSDTSSKNLI